MDFSMPVLFHFFASTTVSTLAAELCAGDCRTMAYVDECSHLVLWMCGMLYEQSCSAQVVYVYIVFCTLHCNVIALLIIATVFQHTHDET